MEKPPEEFSAEERQKIYDANVERLSKADPPRKRTPKPKYKSRATRASEQAAEWRALAERLGELPEDLSDVPPELEDAFKADVLKDAQSIIEDFSASELESLAEEMRGWADNYPDNLRGGDKYSAIDEAASMLENFDTEAPGIDSYDSIEEAVNTLNERADELEGVEFPGMFG